MLPWSLFYLSVALWKGDDAVQPTPSGFLVEYHTPPTRFETYGEGLNFPTTPFLETTAMTIVQDIMGLPDSAIAYTSGLSAEDADYAYLAQSHHNIAFINAVANLVLKDGKIISFGESFVDLNQTTIASPYPRVQVNEAIHTAESAFNGIYNQHPSKLEYYVKKDTSVALVHTIQIQNDDDNTWVEVYIDAHTGSVAGSANFVAEALYHVVPVGKSKPEEHTDVPNPQDVDASPLGWHRLKLSQTELKETAGNNVVAYIGEPRTSKPSADDLVFKYVYDTNKGPTEGSNQDAARTNAFYIMNIVHDFSYRYGFNEQRFNFQENNFGKGGKENDRVKMVVQSSEGTSNAQFTTPPDGQSGVCHMYIWTGPPDRDGDLDNSVMVHEMAHGITNRLTGGGTARCLQRLESRGLDEGYADIVADWTEQTTTLTQDFVIGRYAANRPNGIRKFPYSVKLTVNPLKYSDLTKAMDDYDEHAAGEIWANILHNVYAKLVDNYGHTNTAKTSPDRKEGNVIFMHLIIETLSTQPCNPSFIQARDALLNVFEKFYKGDVCLLWPVFAQRGLGFKAEERDPKKGYVDNFEWLPGCKPKSG